MFINKNPSYFRNWDIVKSVNLFQDDSLIQLYTYHLIKKLLLLFVVFGGFTLPGAAQNSGKGVFSIGLENGLPVGSIKKTQGMATGGSVKYTLPIAKNTAFTATAGYVSFSGKDIPAYSDHAPYNTGYLEYVPVKGGIKYNLAEGFYAEAQIGAALHVNYNYNTAFVYSPGIGYNFGKIVDLGVRYEAWTITGGTIGQIATRLAFNL